ncbi:MAG TPA: hypothetical protein VN026_10290 [Bacteroidia bacterium]|jgi:hypothetical protein|nr:hypothetical protein [Bacteroidia bacterium]
MKNSAAKKNSKYKITQNATLAKLTVKQYQKKLMKKFSNIICISDAVHDLDHHQTHIVAIYITDGNISGLPEKLLVKMPNGKTKEIPTEIIKDVGNGKLHFNQSDGILNDTWIGSICCMIQMPDKKTTGIITAGHVYTKGYSNLNNGWLSTEDAKNVNLDNNTSVGNWSFLMLNTLQDLAVIKLSQPNNDASFVKFSANGYYKVTDGDVKKEKVTLISKINGIREGFVLDYNCAWPVPYYNGTQVKNNVILVGSVNERGDSSTLSAEGDSGGCVYHTITGKMVGIILGGDKKYTWVLPIKDTLDYWEFTII